MDGMVQHSASCRRVSLCATTPYAECSEEIVNGLLFRPEVAQKVLRVAWKGHMLVRDQLIDRGMPFANVLVSQRHR